MIRESFEKSKHIAIIVFLLGLGFLAVFLFYTRGGKTESIDPNALKYYRAVFVLQKTNNLAMLEKEIIPERIRFHYSTESLLHQQDALVRLKQVVKDLAEVSALYPKAILFEAYARQQLGENDLALKLMGDYVANAPYENRYYAWLCHFLRKKGDYTSLYLMADEWSVRAGMCQPDNAEHIWAALYSLGKYREAQDFLLDKASCLGWQKEVMLAKTLEALGQTEESSLLLQGAFANFPDEQINIETYWQAMKDKTVL